MEFHPDGEVLFFKPTTIEEHKVVRRAVARRLEDAATGRSQLPLDEARSLLQYLNHTPHDRIASYGVKLNTIGVFASSLEDIARDLPDEQMPIALGASRELRIEADVMGAGEIPDYWPFGQQLPD